MKNTLTVIGAVAICYFAMMGFGAFIFLDEWDFNILTWESRERFIFTLVYFVVLACALAALSERDCK